jgi:hypothetical protein
MNSALHDPLSLSTHISMLTFGDSDTFLNTRHHTFLHAQLVDELPILVELFHTCRFYFTTFYWFVPDKAVHLESSTVSCFSNTQMWSTTLHTRCCRLLKVKTHPVTTHPIKPSFLRAFHYTCTTKCIVETDDSAVWTWRHFPPQLSSD